MTSQWRMPTITSRVLQYSTFLALCSLIAAAQTPGGTVKSTAQPIYKDPGASIQERVDDLVSRMTLEEKVSQLMNNAKAIPRLGIPEYHWWSEGLHGVGFAGEATVFPQAIGVGASWNTDLLHRTASAIGDEVRVKYQQTVKDGNPVKFHGLTTWAPNINIFRDPRWGRGQETYGEDPFLTAQFAVAYVTGLQGDNPQYLKAIATPKHFDVHSGPELLRHAFDASVSPRDLESTYLPAFRAAITQGKAGSIMCSYNAVDGVPACASASLLQSTLRDTWHFDGYVVSDCGAIGDVWENHHFAADNIHGSALAVTAGTDLSCGEQYEALIEAVRDHLVDSQIIDQAVKRLFTARFRLGMFDPPDLVPYTKIPLSELNSPQHRQLALQSARESMVLLKNQHKILPLRRSIKTIAVIGPEADFLPALLGNYNGTPVDPITPLTGIERRFAGQTMILYAQGSKLVEEEPVPVPAGVLQPDHSSQRSLGGLTGEYFDNDDWQGKAAVTRTDPSIDFDWAGVSPIQGLKDGKFSVRWTGTFTPPAPGEYRLGVHIPGCYPCSQADQFNLYLDGKIIAQRTTNSQLLIPITFANTRAHSIRLDYAHSRGNDDKDVAFGPDPAGITLSWDPPADALLKQAVAVAKQADVILAFVGLSPNLESEETPALNIPGFRGGDRTAIGLPPLEEHLLETLGTTGKPIVVVLENGSALAVNWAQAHASAILEAWYPGEEGGTAIAETIAGDNNPAGRLPITFYKSVAQLPPFTDYSMDNRTYRYFTGKPLYAFGYGLSYSDFGLSDLRLSAPSIRAGSSLAVDANVTNTSRRDGDDVVELYLNFPKAPYVPIRALRGFARLSIPAGETRHVHFALSPRDLSEVNASGERVIAPGLYQLSIGGSQPGPGVITLRKSFSIDGSKPLPR